ncbi:hypothetical protein QTP70_028602, partial [Hemibagrus guttatus]
VVCHPCAPVGYANEVGEAFRALVPVSMVWASYAVATAYVSADAVDKGKKAAVAHGDHPGKTTRVAVAVVDTFVWQALASVAIPGFTINRVCAASLYLLGQIHTVAFNSAQVDHHCHRPFYHPLHYQTHRQGVCV